VDNRLLPQQDSRVADNYKHHRPIKGTIVAMVCKRHGFIRGSNCPECDPVTETVNVRSESWIPGWYENITNQPVYIRDKRHLIDTCEKHGVLARALMKQKSQGKGWEHGR